MEQKLNFSTIKEKIINTLGNSKEQEILSRRFGLNGENPETLESIGRSFSVTRERIRQIEKNILYKIDLAPDVKETFDFLEHIVASKGGIVSGLSLEKLLNVSDNNSRMILKILLESSSRFEEIRNQSIKYSLMLKKYSSKTVYRIADRAEKILEKLQNILEQDELVGLIIKEDSFLEDNNIDKAFIKATLLVAINIGKTSDGKLGLTNWGVVRPKNTRDKIYIILRDYKKPLHFKKITELIKDANFSKKVMGVEAVHNELIRDKRFILIGRGIYALREWGYKPGTVSDVIEEIMKEEDRPMHKNEIIEKVLAKRIVKKNTILLNLQEKPQFERVKRAVYKLRNSND